MTKAEAPAQSPFLPGTKIQFAWDSTSLGYLKTCPRLYQYVMVDGWGHAEESIHLRFGMEYHQALQDYDMHLAAGFDHEAAIRKVVHETLSRTWDRSLGPWTPDPALKAASYKNRSTLIRSIIYYLDKFHGDPAQTYILEGGKPAVELSFRFELGWGPQRTLHPDGTPADMLGHPQPYLLCGHLDRVVTYQESLFVMDHKTTTTTPGQYFFDQFEPSNQMTLYSLAGQVVVNAPIRGVIISAAQLLVNDTRFQRGFTFRTPDQLSEWTEDLRHWLLLAEHYATIGYWPQNDTACDKFGGCRFRKICSKSPQVREQYLKSHFTKLPEDQRWNPLKPR